MTKTIRMPALRAALYGAANLIWYGCLLAICAVALTTCAPAPAHAVEMGGVEWVKIGPSLYRSIDHTTGVACYAKSTYGREGISCVQFKEAQQ